MLGGLTDSLVNAQNQTSGLDGRLNGVNLDQARFPDKGGHVIPDAFVVKVHTSPRVALVMFHPEAVQNVRSVKACIVAQLSGDNLQSLGKRLHNGLLLVGHVSVGIPMEVAGQLQFCGTTTRNDGCVAQCTLNNHDGVVQTSFDFSNELLCSTAQHKGARLRLGALGKQVVPLPTNLAFLKRAASTQVTVLDIAACGLDGSTSRLAHTVHIV